MKNSDSYNPLLKNFLLSLHHVGGVSKMSSLLKIKPQTIYSWLSKRTKKRFPDANHCILIEKATHGEIRKEDLRPDIFNPSKKVLSPEESLKEGFSLIKKAFDDLNEGKQ